MGFKVQKSHLNQIELDLILTVTNLYLRLDENGSKEKNKKQLNILNILRMGMSFKFSQKTINPTKTAFDIIFFITLL